MMPVMAVLSYEERALFGRDMPSQREVLKHLRALNVAVRRVSDALRIILQQTTEMDQALIDLRKTLGDQ
jgi:hypothetical protein